MAVVTKIVPKMINREKLREEIAAASAVLQSINLLGFDQINARQFAPSAAPKQYGQDVAAIGEIRFQTTRALTPTENTGLNNILIAHDGATLTPEQQREDQDAADVQALINTEVATYVGNIQGWDAMTAADKMVATKENFIILAKALRLIVRQFKKGAAISILFALLLPAVANADLIAWWRFNEGAGTTAADAIGGNTGSLIGSPVWIASGKSGAALSFQYLDTDYVQISDAHITSSNDWSIFAWVMPGAGDGILPRTIFVSGDGTGGGSGIEFRLETTDELLCRAVVGADSEEDAVSTATVSNAGVWTLVGCVKSGTSLKTYINATNDGSTVLTTTTMDWIGDGGQVHTRIALNQNAFSPFQGLIDEVRLYNHGLSQTEINGLYGTRRPIAPQLYP